MDILKSVMNIGEEKERIRVAVVGREEEIAKLLKEIHDTDLIIEQVESRKARIDFLKKEISQMKLMHAVVYRAGDIAGKFSPVAVPGDWSIGYAEEIATSTKGTIISILLFALFIGSGIMVPLIFLPAGDLLSKIFIIVLCTLLALVISSGVISNIVLHNDPKSHAVFKGIIPVDILNRYREVEGFDDVIIASPNKDAFLISGVRADPIMLGVIWTAGKKVEFNNVHTTLKSAGLDKAYLFEIGRWDE